MEAARSGLQEYLTASSEKTDAQVLNLVRGLDLWRVPAIVAAFGGREGAQAYYAEQDLLALHRFLVMVLARVEEIDTWVLLYRFGPGRWPTSSRKSRSFWKPARDIWTW